MNKITNIKITAITLAVGSLVLLTEPAFAADVAGVNNVENFIRTIITVISGLAGLVATVFIVIGGFGYITSSGNPEHLDRAKRTLLWSLIGLAIVIAAFVISNIIVSVATSAFGS